MSRIKYFLAPLLLSLAFNTPAADDGVLMAELTVDLIRVLGDGAMQLERAEAVILESNLGPAGVNRVRAAIAGLESTLAMLEVQEKRGAAIGAGRARDYYRNSIAGYRAVLSQASNTLLQMTSLLKSGGERELANLAASYRQRSRGNKQLYLQAGLDLAFARHQLGLSLATRIDGTTSPHANPFELAAFTQGLERQRVYLNDKSYLIISRFLNSPSEYILELSRVSKSLQQRKALSETQLRMALDTVTNLNMGWSYTDRTKLGEAVMQLSGINQDAELRMLLANASAMLTTLFA